MNTKEMPVSLTHHEWSVLLNQLEHDFQICNVGSHREIILLYEKITEQLNGYTVHVVHKDNPNPDFRPQLPKPKPVETKIAEKKPWWKTFRKDH